MTRPSPFAHSWAVVIGIDAYANGIPALRTASADARRLAALLADAHGYDVTTLLDADASHARITTLLGTELPAKVGPDDRLLFYFAGHGVARDGDDGPAGFLLPADARSGDATSYLDMPRVHDALLALPCRHALVVLDSCFSGAFKWSGTRDVDEVPEVVHQERYDRYVQSPAWQVITSAAHDEKAIDVLTGGVLGTRDASGTHSPFATALFDALGGAGDLVPAGTGDGLITATELFLYLRETLQDAVEAAGKEQTPGLIPLRKQDRGEYVFFIPGRDLALPPAPPLTFENNPWRGLASYDAAQASLFFGRDAEIAALRRTVQAHALTVVLGASGTGKSSLAKAGVLPRLTADGWLVLPVVRPGSQPLLNLAQALGTDGTTAPAATRDAIAARIDALLAATPGRQVALMVDQFEELITLVRSSAERDTTLAMLADLATRHADQLRIIVTIRTDFEPNFDRSAFGDLWRDGRFVVPPMSRGNLRAVIEKAAAARVLYFEPSKLVEALLDDVAATPGALPLLSFALSEMYIAYVKRRSSDRAITQADYEALGGVVGALRARAESEYAALDAAHQATLRRVMLRLVSSDGGGLARRRVADAELDFDDDGERTRAAEVVRRLTEARLLVEGKEPDGEAFVEPAHDALVRAWGRLLEWVREENEATFPLVQQQKLARAADEWSRSAEGTRSGLLWSDAARSSSLSPLVRQRAPFLNRREMQFAQRSVRGRFVVLGTISAAVLALGVAGVLAIISGRRASERAEQVRVGAVVRTAGTMVTEDPLTAGLLLGSLDSAAVAGADDATRLAMLGVATQLGMQPTVMATFGTVGEQMSAAAVSHDETFLVAATSGDSTVRVWNTDDRGAPRVLRGAPGNIVTLAVSHDDKVIAAGGEEGWVRVWRVDGTAPPRSIAGRTGPAGRVRRLLFSPDDSLLLVGADDGGAALVDLTRDTPALQVDGEFGAAEFGTDASTLLLTEAFGNTPAMIMVPTAAAASPAAERPVLRRFPMDSAILASAVSPDRRRVAIGSSSGAVAIYDLATRRAPLRLSPVAADRGAVASLTWNADGSELAVASLSAPFIDVRDSESGDLLQELRHPDAVMQAPVFSPGMSRIVTTSDADFQAMVWDMPGTQRRALGGHTQQLLLASFMHDDLHLLTASWDGGARLWALPVSPLQPPEWPEPVPGQWRTEGQNVTAAAFSTDSRHLALGTARGVVMVYTPDRSGIAKRLPNRVMRMQQLAFSADGAMLHAVSGTGERISWSLAGLDSGRTTPPTMRLPQFPQAQEAIAANGSIAAIHYLENDLFLLDLAGTQAPRRFETRQRGVFCTAFSDDGRRVATCGTDSTVVIARSDGTGSLRTIRRGGARPGAIAFAHDSAMFAVGYEDGLVRVFTGAATDTGRVLRGHRQRIRQLAFARGGERLLSTSDDGSVRTWDVATGASLSTLRPRGLVVGAAAFLPDGRRLVTRGVSEREVRLWNVDGSGGSVAFPIDGGTVAVMTLSPDGRWLFIAGDAETFTLYPLDPDDAIRPFRASLAACLSQQERMRLLMEPAKDAAVRSASCGAQQRTRR